MKKYLIALLLLLSAVIPTPSQTSTGTKYADSRKLFREVMGAGSVMVSTMEKLDWEVVKIDMDLVGVGNDKQTIKKMSSNFSYIVSAVGQPSRIADLDLQVFYVGADGSTTLIASDNKIDNDPTVSFQPPVSGTYMIVIKAAKMVEGSEGAMGFYFLAIAHS